MKRKRVPAFRKAKEVSISKDCNLVKIILQSAIHQIYSHFKKVNLPLYKKRAKGLCRSLKTVTQSKNLKDIPTWFKQAIKKQIIFTA